MNNGPVIFKFIKMTKNNNLFTPNKEQQSHLKLYPGTLVLQDDLPFDNRRPDQKL